MAIKRTLSHVPLVRKNRVNSIIKSYSIDSLSIQSLCRVSSNATTCLVQLIEERDQNRGLYSAIALFYRQYCTWDEFFRSISTQILSNPERRGNFLLFLLTWIEVLPTEFASFYRQYCVNSLIGALDAPFCVSLPTLDTIRDLLSSLSPLPDQIQTTHYKGCTITSSILEFSPEAIAETICAMDYRRLKSIDPTEFVAAAWIQSDRMTKAPNIVAMIEWSNRLAWIVIQEILLASSSQSLKSGRRLAKHLIRVGYALDKQRNFGSLKTLIISLTHYLVIRQKDPVDGLNSTSRRQLQAWKQNLSEAYNWKRLREEEKTGPCLPFLGLHLTDLIHLQELIPGQFLNDDHTLTAWIKTTNYIRDLINLVENYHVPQPHAKIEAFFKNYKLMSEDELALMIRQKP